MISGSDAATILRNCIRLVSGFEGEIALDDQLQDVGIESSNSQESLKIEIATNRDIGLPHFDHTMSIGDFTFTETSLVSDVRLQIVEIARPDAMETEKAPGAP